MGNEVSVRSARRVLKGYSTMNIADIVGRMNSEWERISQVAEQEKNSASATVNLIRLYQGFAVQNRTAASQAVIQWAMSDVPEKRFDGLAIIDECKIYEAIPTLKELCGTLERAGDPAAPYDLAKVQRIISRLSSQESLDTPLGSDPR